MLQKIGKLNLTPDQIRGLPKLHSEKVRGFEIRKGFFYVSCAKEITGEELEALKEAMLGLVAEPKVFELNKQEIKKNNLINLTPAQIDSYVDDKVKNIEDVKTEMKKLLRLVNYLAGKIN